MWLGCAQAIRKGNHGRRVLCGCFQVVSSRGLFEVYVWWWGEPCCGALKFYCPLASVDEAVVVWAEEHQVFQLCWASFEVGFDVVCVGCAGGAVAAGECAAFVAEDEASADVGGDDVLRDCHVQGL